MRTVRYLSAALLVPMLAPAACETAGATGELSRAECVQMTVKIDKLRNAELGRSTSVKQRNTVDGCMAHGTKAQYECVQFANNGGELVRCDDLAK